MISFREKAAITLYADCVASTVENAADLAQLLADGCCAKWGHTGDADTCGRCGLRTGARQARFEEAKERTIAILKRSSASMSFNEIYVLSKGVGKRTLEAALGDLARDGHVVMKREGRSQSWQVP